MPRFRRLALMSFVAVLLFAAAPPARSAQPVPKGQPADAVKGFFVAVTAKDYATAWASLSSASQARIVQLIAADEKMDPAAVQKLFDTNDEAIQRGFWDSFRDSSQSATYAAKGFSTVEVSGDRAKVAMDGIDPAQLTFQAFLEGGRWRFGLTETFPM